VSTTCCTCVPLCECLESTVVELLCYMGDAPLFCEVHCQHLVPCSDQHAVWLPCTPCRLCAPAVSLAPAWVLPLLLYP
jgi:hypothetical protein